MTLPVQGVRSLERAGALVAGADDPDALWLDPAGLGRLAGDGRKSLLFDVAYLYQNITYTPADGSPRVTNQQPGVALPSIAGALGIGDRLVIAAGFTATYAGLHRYDDTGAQRYASVGLAGTSFVEVALGAAYVLSPTLRVGATLQDRVTALDLRIVASGCPPQAVCAPDDVSYDMPLHVQQTSYFAPSGSAGVQWDASEFATLGLAIQAPARVSASGSLATRVPANALFTGATLTGSDETTSFTLPPAVRAGVEIHPSPELRVEAALDVELWSLHDHIDIVPNGVAITNVALVGSYQLAAMRIPRDYQTSFAPSLGGELRLGPAVVGAGAAFETAAAPKGDISALTVDGSRVLVALGGGYAEGGWQLGGALGYTHVASTDVGASDARVTQLQALRAQPTPVYVNAGTYKASYIIAGIRAARTF